MKKSTKAEKRRALVLNKFWFKKYGDETKPSNRTRMTWKHLGMPQR